MRNAPPPHTRLLIVSPVKNEEAYLERTIKCILDQEARPTRWIIVDDGSTDRTAEIADAAAREHSWIEVVHRRGTAERRVGPGVVEAFYEGLSRADLRDYDFVCKLDGDLEFRPGYFAEMFRRFADDPRLGTASGKTFIVVGEKYVPERLSDEISHGVAKLYRRECFEEIGGFVREVMWDGIDCHRCRMLGWEAVSFGDPELAIVHLRQMGSSHKSIYHGRLRWGRGQYFMGTHPLYMISSSAYRAFERPWVLGGACILIGYISAWIHGARRYEEPGFRRFLHRWQMNQLLSRLTGRKPKPVGRKMNSGFHPLSASKRASMAARRAEK